MKTITLNLSDEEFETLSKMCQEAGMSKSAVLRQSIRLYQLVSKRMKDGETMSFSGDKERAIQFIGVGF